MAWVVLLALTLKVYVLVKAKLPGDVLSYAIIALLLLSGAMSIEQTLSCFSATSVVLIGVLSVVSAGLIHSGVLHWLVRHVMGTPRNQLTALVRLMLPVGASSAFLNNATVVTMFIPVVKMWSRKLSLQPSKLLIPLSYAATIGGMCTIFGTPANLVIAHYYQEHMGVSMPLFANLVPGLICLAASIMCLIILRNWLPKRKSPEESFECSTDYTVELVVPAQCPWVGETVKDAGLLDVRGGHLLEIVRFDREIISPVPADEFILGNDHLVYTGRINDILELKSSHGLVNANHLVFSTKDQQRDRKLQLATVDTESPLIGQRLEDSDFETHNHVVLVAIARDGQRLTTIPRETALMPGDTLLLEGPRLAAENFVGSLNFFDSIALPRQDHRTLVSSLIILVMVLLSSTGVMPLIKSAFLAAVLMYITGCCSTMQLQQSINWKLIMSFAGSVCLGNAMDVTGLTTHISDALMMMGHHNLLISLIVLCTSASLLTEFISNTAAAAIFAPIAISVATMLGVNPLIYCTAIMVAINCSFATPMGNETNLIIYGPGGYRFADFLRIGIPMNIVMLFINVTLAYTAMQVYQ